MVQVLLAERRTVRSVALLVSGVMLLACAAEATTKPAPKADVWVMSLDGGRKLSWQRSFSAEWEVRPNRGFWNKVVDVVAGAPDYRSMVRPYSVVTDSKGRIIVSDPGAKGVHIFDFAQRKYKFIDRTDKNRNVMMTPQCVAVDAADNIYVTDSDKGEVFVFEPSGKLLRVIGSLKGGEGYFKRPTGIAVDSTTGRIYVSDTLRDQVFVLDMHGKVLGTIGQNGTGDGEFNYPTELRMYGSNLLVVDAMNFRVQVFDGAGKFSYAIGKLGDSTGAMFRPKAVSVDSEGDLYIVDGLWGVVQVFNPAGQLLYTFGAQGTHAGEFNLPTGLSIDHEDRVLVVDSYNRRVQMFQYTSLKKRLAGEAK